MRFGSFPLWIGSQIGGIATYDAELLPALAEAAPDDEFHIFSASRVAIRRLRLQRANVVHHQLFPQSRWINVPVSFPLAAAFLSLDLVHMTHVPPPVFAGPYVMTLHCFSTFNHPEFYPKSLRIRMNALTKHGLRSARVVLCVSRGLSDLAERELKITADRLAVAYNGVSPEFRQIPRERALAHVREQYGLSRPYLLFVGVIAPRKNVARIVSAFDLFRRETRSDAQLVLVGRKWLAEDVDQAVRRLRLENEVIHVPHVDHDKLPELYSAAEMLVFPSLWESFGMPVVESMACGTPVLTSRGSCLPEIAGDAALYVDPYSVESIAAGMTHLWTDASLVNTLRIKGLQRASRFTWSNCAAQTLAAYRQALQ